MGDRSLLEADASRCKTTPEDPEGSEPEAIARARADAGIHLAVARSAARIDRTAVEREICDTVEELSDGRRTAAPPS